ncbi:hypothetical protein BDW75DRAFT_245476 [Aspergillus navahoensis]
MSDAKQVLIQPSLKKHAETAARHRQRKKDETRRMEAQMEELDTRIAQSQRDSQEASAYSAKLAKVIADESATYQEENAILRNHEVDMEQSKDEYWFLQGRLSTAEPSEKNS